MASDTIKISASDTINPGIISYTVNIPGRLSAPHIAVGTYAHKSATAPPDITPLPMHRIHYSVSRTGCKE